MSSIIAVAVFAACFFGLYKLFRTDWSGEKHAKTWPEAEATILKKNRNQDCYIYVEFWDGEKMVYGKSVGYDYVENYKVGDKVMVWYKLTDPKNISDLQRKLDAWTLNRTIEASVILQDPKLLTIGKRQRDAAWGWLIPAFGFVIFDLVLIVQYIMNISQ